MVSCSLKICNFIKNYKTRMSPKSEGAHFRQIVSQRNMKHKERESDRRESAPCGGKPMLTLISSLSGTPAWISD